VVYALQRLCFSHYVAGELGAVRSAAEEALLLGTSIGHPAMTTPPTAWLALLAAVQGRDDYDELLLRAEEGASHPLGILADPVHDVLRWAKAARAAATGDQSAALHHLSRFRLPPLSRMAAVERLDAAVRADEPGLARTYVDELAAFADATRRPWALATSAYGRAITAGTAADAEARFEEALSYVDGAGRRLDEARIQLAYGEWLRRAQRRVDSRRHLRRALETFQDMRAEALADRATRELRASGETARKRDPSTLVKLTPMELKIAELVSSGMSNKDVAAQIWVSPRTVAFHLRNIFAKAGVTSRGELARLDFAS
jgi:DNA-binding CsgD family transcriptional regulator